MSKRRLIKVRYFPGARIRDTFFYLVPLLHKKPKKMILHIGTNESTIYSATEIAHSKVSDINPNTQSRQSKCKFD